jgi:hypothetical protein
MCLLGKATNGIRQFAIAPFLVNERAKKKKKKSPQNKREKKISLLTSL